MGNDLEYEAAFAGRVSELFDFTVITGAAAIEHDRDDAGGLGLGGKGGAKLLGAGEVGGEFLGAETGLEAREENQRCAGFIVHRLGIDMFRAELDAEARTDSGAGDFFADSPATFLKEFGFVNGVHGWTPEILGCGCR